MSKAFSASSSLHVMSAILKMEEMSFEKLGKLMVFFEITTSSGKTNSGRGIIWRKKQLNKTHTLTILTSDSLVNSIGAVYVWKCSADSFFLASDVSTQQLDNGTSFLTLTVDERLGANLQDVFAFFPQGWSEPQLSPWSQVKIYFIDTSKPFILFGAFVKDMSDSCLISMPTGHKEEDEALLGMPVISENGSLFAIVVSLELYRDLRCLVCRRIQGPHCALDAK